ncbi:hypothetical protein GWI33_009308 [Rhynchophorus ferrugineus]|uniref:Uncharacterized protein n=1 Tax=Rhynchophorus ferrugineus TaxID=354439 RepID=A0A834IAQ7_RHYFE|nr:hypothetical protein GWI33_009308 [Rhynchophorus ferrugineus]
MFEGELLRMWKHFSRRRKPNQTQRTVLTPVRMSPTRITSSKCWAKLWNMHYPMSDGTSECFYGVCSEASRRPFESLSAEMGRCKGRRRTMVSSRDPEGPAPNYNI